jgi:intracellular sulfur oxidation DsrE/DsrF family protein
MEYLYHTVEAENIRTGYGQHENVDFNLNFPGRAIVCGSVRLEGEVEILPDGNAQNDGTQSAGVDHMIGAHSFIASCVTTFQNSGIIENATELPRFVKMKTTGSATDQDMMAGHNVCELRSPDRIISHKVLMPRYPSDVGGGARGNANVTEHQGSGMASLAQGTVATDLVRLPDFSIKPSICLNGVVSPNSLLNYSTSGEIKLSFNLARNLECLFGEDVATGAKYELKNLEVCFTTIPEPAKQEPLTLRTMMCLKSTVNSAMSNHSSRIPVVADSMSVSFLDKDHEVSQYFSNTALEQPPGITNIKYAFNDSTSSYITYELKNKLEIISEGVKALSSGTHTNIRADLLDTNESFVAGVSFGSPLDLSKQKLNIQLNSLASTTNSYLMFQYYHSMVSM